MKKRSQFKEGDKVFAKVKGYAAWPAMVVAKSGKKFSVQFYGTGETGYVKPEELFYYIRNKTSLARGSKKREFLEGLSQIESAIAADGGTDGSDMAVDEETEVAVGTKRKRSISDKSMDSQASKKGRKKTPEPTQSYGAPSNIEAPESNKSDESDNEIEAFNEKQLISIEKVTYNEPKEDSINLVSEQDLKHWITYSEYVLENPDHYKEKPADNRKYSQNQVIPVEVSEKYVALKLHESWPISFENEYENAMYDSQVAQRLLALKDQVVNGEVTPETDPDSFLSNFKMTESEIKHESEAEQIYAKYQRVGRLRRELRMVDLDVKIKNCLGLTKANPEKALELLDDLIAIDFDELMLKKHSHVAEMIKRLRRYVGNSEEWDMSDHEAEKFFSSAQTIREKANEAYSKIRSVIKVPAGATNFWDSFTELVKKFREDCTGLSNKDVFTLCAEPLSRRAILDRLEQNQDLEEIEIPQGLDDEENSSEVANSESKVADAE